MSADSRSQLNLGRRFYALAALDSIVAALLYVELGLPLALPGDEALMGIAFTALIAAQNCLRIDSRTAWLAKNAPVAGTRYARSG